MARTSHAMYILIRETYARRTPKHCKPTSTEDVLAWNDHVSRAGNDTLGLPILNMSVDLSHLTPTSLVPNVPDNLKVLTLTAKKDELHLSKPVSRAVSTLLVSTASSGPSSLLSLNLSIPTSLSTLPTLPCLRSLTLSFPSGGSPSLPDLSSLSACHLTSLTLDHLETIPLPSLLESLSHFPDLTRLSLRNYVQGGTAAILNHLSELGRRHITDLRLAEGTMEPSAPSPHDSSMDIRASAVNDPPSLDVESAWKGLANMGVRLRSLELDHISTGDGDLLGLLHSLWFESLHQLSLTNVKVIHLMGTHENPILSWPHLHTLHLKHISHLHILSSSSSSSVFPRVQHLTLQEIVSVRKIPSQASSSSFSPATSSLFPGLQSLTIGDVPWECHSLAMAPKANITLDPPMRSRDMVLLFILRARALGPNSIRLPSNYPLTSLVLLTRGFEWHGLGRVGELSVPSDRLRIAQTMCIGSLW